MKPQGVIFDFDGTLADTLPDLTDAVNVGLAAFGLPPQPLVRVRDWIGEGLPTLCQRAIGGNTQAPVDEVVRIVTAHYRVHRLDKTSLYPGVAEVLDELTRRQIPVAILTNKPHEHTTPMTDALFARWRFVAVEGYKQESLRKPDPRTALDVAARMERSPERILMVGDSFTDVRTALNAGMVPVGVTWGYRSRQELIDAGARHLLDRAQDLLNLL